MEMIKIAAEVEYDPQQDSEVEDVFGPRSKGEAYWVLPETVTVHNIMHEKDCIKL
jgi:hypothetical protein